MQSDQPFTQLVLYTYPQNLTHCRPPVPLPPPRPLPSTLPFSSTSALYFSQNLTPYLPSDPFTQPLPILKKSYPLQSSSPFPLSVPYTNPQILPPVVRSTLSPTRDLYLPPKYKPAVRSALYPTRPLYLPSKSNPCRSPEPFPNPSPILTAKPNPLPSAQPLPYTYSQNITPAVRSSLYPTRPLYLPSKCNPLLFARSLSLTCLLYLSPKSNPLQGA